jgi:hypothetical protein
VKEVPLTRFVLNVSFGPTLGGDLGDVHFFVLNLNLRRRGGRNYASELFVVAHA